MIDVERFNRWNGEPKQLIWYIHHIMSNSETNIMKYSLTIAFINLWPHIEQNWELYTNNSFLNIFKQTKPTFDNMSYDCPKTDPKNINQNSRFFKPNQQNGNEYEYLWNHNKI